MQIQRAQTILGAISQVGRKYAQKIQGSIPNRHVNMSKALYASLSTLIMKAFASKEASETGKFSFSSILVLTLKSSTK